MNRAITLWGIRSRRKDGKPQITVAKKIYIRKRSAAIMKKTVLLIIAVELLLSMICAVAEESTGIAGNISAPDPADCVCKQSRGADCPTDPGFSE